METIYDYKFENNCKNNDEISKFLKDMAKKGQIQFYNCVIDEKTVLLDDADIKLELTKKGPALVPVAKEVKLWDDSSPLFFDGFMKFFLKDAKTGRMYYNFMDGRRREQSQELVYSEQFDISRLTEDYDIKGLKNYLNILGLPENMIDASLYRNLTYYTIIPNKIYA